jgi:hypothetical protein
MRSDGVMEWSKKFCSPDESFPIIPVLPGPDFPILQYSITPLLLPQAAFI